MPKCDFNSNFIEIALRHGFYSVNWLRIFRTPFLKNTSGRLLLNVKLFALCFDMYSFYKNQIILHHGDKNFLFRHLSNSNFQQ